MEKIIHRTFIHFFFDFGKFANFLITEEMTLKTQKNLNLIYDFEFQSSTLRSSENVYILEVTTYKKIYENRSLF